MKKYCFTILVLFGFTAIAQSEVEPPIEEQFDVVAKRWLDKSKYLKKYAGINEYCQNPAFRKSTDRILTEIHQYDSLILSKLEDPTAYFSWDIKEEKKTLKDVHQFEEAYGMEAFIDHMRESCVFRNEIESNKENLRKSVGMESYDGKILVLETEMVKYLKKIDKLILKIDDHLHVLHLEQ